MLATEWNSFFFQFYQIQALLIWQFLTWSMSPTFPAIWSSGRQRKPRGPTLYWSETSTFQIRIYSYSEVWSLKVLDQKRRPYHFAFQELPRTSPNVSSQHERPTMDVDLLKKIGLNTTSNSFIHHNGQLWVVVGRRQLWCVNGQVKTIFGADDSAGETSYCRFYSRILARNELYEGK